MSLFFAVLLIAALISAIIRARRRMPTADAPALTHLTGPTRITFSRSAPALEDVPRWLLTANALYSVWLGRPVNELQDLAGRPTYKYTLAKQWAVTDRDNLLFQIVFLFHNGSRREMRVLQQTDPKLPQDHLLGFDLARYFHLCVAGCSMGYLTPEEANVLLLHGGRALQRAYPSWEAYASAVVAGYIVQQVNLSLELDATRLARLRALRRAAKALTRSRRSPWRHEPFDQPLPAPVLDDFFDRTSRTRLSNAIIYLDEDAFVPSDTHWAMAVGAMYHCSWGDPVDMLINDNAQLPGMLKNGWGVTDRQEATDILAWLAEEGHRGALKALQNQLPTAPVGDVQAWDWVRLIQVAMGAAALGYLQPNEALNATHYAALKLQRAYPSWDAMKAGFVSGRILWRRLNEHPQTDALKEEDDSFDALLTLLSTDPQSPWAKVPWDFPLSPLQEGAFFLTCLAQRQQDALQKEDLYTKLNPKALLVQEAAASDVPEVKLLN